MRKTLIAAIAALTALALAAVALAQNPAPTASLEVSVAPTKVGTTKKPRSGRLELNAETNRESKSTASKIEISIPKGAKLSTKGLKACSFGKVNAQGKAACPKASKAGSGEADALLNPYADEPRPDQVRRDGLQRRQAQLDGRGDAEAAVPEQRQPVQDRPRVLIFHLQSASPEVDQALAGVITKVTNKIYGQRITIEIAPNLQQPANNVYSSLQRLETSIGLKSGEHMLMALTDCPKARENQFQLKLTFVPNPTPPATTTATAIDGARCSG